MIVLLAIGFCLAPPVFKASNRATIEKPDPGGDDHLGKVDLLIIDNAPAMSFKIDRYNLEAIVPSEIVIEPQPAAYAQWKPFGEVNTKYHAAWLFHPLKLC